MFWHRLARPILHLPGLRAPILRRKVTNAARKCARGLLDTNRMRPGVYPVWVYTDMVEGAKTEIPVEIEQPCG